MDIERSRKGMWIIIGDFYVVLDQRDKTGVDVSLNPGRVILENLLKMED